MPIPEDQLLQVLGSISGGRTGTYAPQDPVQTWISIAIFADDTQIRYDQWENGFERNIANPSEVYAADKPAGTQIWGDGDVSNGCAPGFPADLLHAGDVIQLTNAVSLATRGETLAFDGGDKFVTSRPVAVTRMGWASGSGTSFAGANEVYDTAFWGTAFQCPVGTDISDADDCQIFEYTGLSIMAGADGTVVQVDADADGTYETNAVLAEGEAMLVDGGVRLGGRVASDKPVQVDLITGDVFDYYESRFMRLLPTAYWSASLTSPVSTPSSVVKGGTTYTSGTTVWLYNPGTSAMAVRYVTRSGATLSTNLVTVPGGPAGGCVRQTLTDGFGARFISPDNRPFYAVAVVDSTGTDLSTSVNDTGDNRNWDWGFALVPDASLTPQVLVGFGGGQDPTAAPVSENGNPVWVTPVGNGNQAVTIYVDYDSDPDTGSQVDPEGNRYDASYSARELDQVKIFNPAGNQSGLLAYVLGSDVKLAAAWGPDPSTASTGAPGLDLGTGIPPFPLFVAQKRSMLLIDADQDGFVSPGDTLRYSIAIHNTGRQPVVGLDVEDKLPQGITYQPDTTDFINAAAVTNLIVDDDQSGRSVFPLDEGGIALPEPFLPVRGSWEVQYTVCVDPYDTLPGGAYSLQNTARVGSGGLTMTNTVVTPIYARVVTRVWQDLDEDGVRGDDEPGLVGVTVMLLDAEGEPVLDDAGEPVTAVSTTNAQGVAGFAVFKGVLPSTYRLGYVSPAGLQPTVADGDGQGLFGGANSDAEASSGLTGTFTLGSGQVLEGVDGGFIERAGAVSGHVRLDVDGDGAADPEDTQGVAGVTVQLLNAEGVPVSVSVTSESGSYLFGEVRSGAYTVALLLPSGYTNTVDAVGANDARVPLALAAGQAFEGADFYVARAGSVAPRGKILYLSDSGQTLDRIDPVASGDGTTARSASLVAPVHSNAVIAVVGAAVSSSTASRSVSTHSFTYDSGSSGTNRILMVGISFRNQDGETVTSVTYGGQALALVGTSQNSTDARTEIYRLLRPPTGSNTLRVNWSETLNRYAVVGAVTYAGVNQESPNGAFASASGISRTPSVSVASAAGHVVFGVVGGRTTSDYAVTDGGTALWSDRPSSGQTSGSGQSKTGAGSVTLAWSASNAEWAAGGVSLIPAVIDIPGNPVAAFTQSPAFALPFALSAGAVIAITNYVDVTGGAMPANPAITARLSAGGAPFLTLASPVYTAGALVWSGALSTNVSVAAGQAMTLSISNGASGVSFDLLYDSAASPSKVVLPTSTIIAVPSFGVYDAPYPGGVPLTNVLSGQTCYVRAVATDPFGAYDISGATFSFLLLGKDEADSVTVDDAFVVASNAWSKTYEYAWDAPAFTADCTISVAAHEGSEGIRADASAPLAVVGRSLYGYVFIDRNGDSVFNAGDIPVTNAAVFLMANKKTLASTNSSAIGYYRFVDVPMGNVRLATELLPGARLTTVPSSSSPMRNRAKEDQDLAVIDYDVGGAVAVSTEMIGEESVDLELANEASSTEPLNFGFAEYPLSTALDLAVYASGGGVLIDVWTVNEAGYQDIVIYAWINNVWTEVARVPGWQVIGDGSNRYTAQASGLALDGAYAFKVVDESGHVHYSDGTISVYAMRVAAVRLDMQTLALSFNTEKGRAYVVKTSTDLVNWSVEYVSYPTARGWSEYTDESFTASDVLTQVRVPVNGRKQAFFKVVRADD